jgi:phosphoribosylamine--glycine ligase
MENHKLKILVIGSGGREHAIAWKLAQSDKTEKIYVAPGNGGTACENKCENLTVENDLRSLVGQVALAAFAKTKEIQLTIVGPENFLDAGIVDIFQKYGLAIIGPNKRATQLEASKSFSKEFCKKYGVRTANGQEFTNPDEALKTTRYHFKTQSLPMVIKANGLAAGKGVVIAQDLYTANSTINNFMKNKILGEAGTSIIIENFLPGREVSVMAAVSNGTIKPFIAAKDYKRRFENDAGPNTGGMGAIAPVPFNEEDFLKYILEPTLKGIKAEGFDYKGFLFFGLMINEGKCSLIEYNVRLGDPETQALLPLLESDFVELCEAILNGNLENFPLIWKSGAICAPVLVANGYPGEYSKNDIITIDEAALAKTGAKIFIAGAKLENGLHTTGGRVLAAAGYGLNIKEARRCANKALDTVTFSGKKFRRDIGLVL